MYSCRACIKQTCLGTIFFSCCCLWVNRTCSLPGRSHFSSLASLPVVFASLSTPPPFCSPAVYFLHVSILLDCVGFFLSLPTPEENSLLSLDTLKRFCCCFLLGKQHSETSESNCEAHEGVGREQGCQRPGSSPVLLIKIWQVPNKGVSLTF